MKYLVGVDEGTTGCKACIFDEGGNLVASASREYPSYYPHPGWVEQDIDEIRDACFDSIAEAIENASISSDEIVGISHSNQGITAVLLDENEKPVREHTIGWQDLRYVDDLERYKADINEQEYWDISGMEFGTYNIPVFKWLQENEPENWARVRHICSHQDYFLRQYGADGFYIDEGSANFLSMARMEDCEWDQRLLDVYGVDISVLPKIIHTPGAVVGRVTAEVSKRTGLPVGCAVCLGNLDANSCAIGAGATQAGMQILVMGTAGVSIVVSNSMSRDLNHRITTRTNPGTPDTWQYYIMTNTGASSFRWFRDELCSTEVVAGKLMDVDPYDIITKTASTSVPGANGVVALTGFQGSHTRKKNENARGTFFGINLGTKKADIAEAILEGICYEMRDISAMNEELAGEISCVRLCGALPIVICGVRCLLTSLRNLLNLLKLPSLVAWVLPYVQVLVRVFTKIRLRAYQNALELPRRILPILKKLPSTIRFSKSGHACTIS